MTHVLHYTSADSPRDDATWSVYREQYETPNSDEPIEGTQEWVSRWPTESDANDEADRLQVLSQNAPRSRGSE